MLLTCIVELPDSNGGWGTLYQDSYFSYFLLPIQGGASTAAFNIIQYRAVTVTVVLAALLNKP
jgi:hypothetical protein